MTSKRERELARAKWERQQARRAQAAEKQSVVKRAVLATLAVIAVIVIVLANQGNESTPTARPTQNVPSTPSSQPTFSPSKVCKPHGTLVSSPDLYKSPPTDGPVAKNLVLNTNCGSINIALDSQAPNTTKIMANLAKKGYFNKTPCHRLTTKGIYVLQCGDRSGTGTGSPGFTFADENLPKVGSGSSFTYSRGTVAMANSGPNTNGSQFFIVYKASPLPPNYSIWGRITQGLDVVDKIASAGEQSGQGDGKPLADVAIETATAN